MLDKLRLQNHRKRAGIKSREKMAELMQIPFGTYCAYEQGYRVNKSDDKLADFLELATQVINTKRDELGLDEIYAHELLDRDNRIYKIIEKWAWLMD